jgi:hypothetical protein
MVTNRVLSNRMIKCNHTNNSNSNLRKKNEGKKGDRTFD